MSKSWLFISVGELRSSLLFLNLGVNVRQAFEGGGSAGINVQDNEYGHSDKEPELLPIGSLD